MTHRPTDSREHCNREDRLRRAAKRKGFLLRRNRSRDPRNESYGLYVLVGDCAGNRRPRAQAPISAFQRGEGYTLDGIAIELENLQ